MRAIVEQQPVYATVLDSLLEYATSYTYPLMTQKQACFGRMQQRDADWSRKEWSLPSFSPFANRLGHLMLACMIEPVLTLRR